MVVQAYSYFVPLCDSSPIPILLIDTLSQAQKYFTKITLITTVGVIDVVKNILPDIVCIDRSSLEEPDYIRYYISLIDLEIISSNHPPTEILCLDRWHYMNQSFEKGYLDSRSPCVVLDWDTFLFDSAKVALSCHLDALDPLRTFTCFLGLGVDVSSSSANFPVFDICPNFIIISHEHVSLFCSEALKILSNEHTVRRIYSSRLFNDMSIWSCVVSRCIIQRDHTIIDLDSFPESHRVFFDHNVRISWQRNLKCFDMESYKVDKAYRCTEADQLRIKNIYISDGKFYVVSNEQPFLLGCLHLSGVEAKYIYFKFLRKPILTALGLSRLL